MAYYTTKVKKITANNNSGDVSTKEVDYLLDIIAELEDIITAIRGMVS